MRPMLIKAKAEPEQPEEPRFSGGLDGGCVAKPVFIHLDPAGSACFISSSLEYGQ